MGEAGGHEETAEDAVVRLKREVGSGVRVCVLGSTTIDDSDTAEIVRKLAEHFTEESSEGMVFITGGMGGVQETFAKHCKAPDRLFNLLPTNKASNYGVGKDIHGGADLDARKEIFGRVGDVYVTVSGGPGVAMEARTAHARGAAVVPLIRTGGASSGMFEFPAAALERTKGVTDEQWRALSEKAVPPAEAAAAVRDIIRAKVSLVS